MIKVVKQGAMYAPIITCDYCGEPINNGQGNVLWNDAVVEAATTTEIYFTHKHCDHALEQTLAAPGITTMHEELSVFLIYLANNTKVDLDRATQHQTLFKDHGLAT